MELAKKVYGSLLLLIKIEIVFFFSLYLGLNDLLLYEIQKIKTIILIVSFLLREFHMGYITVNSSFR